MADKTTADSRRTQLEAIGQFDQSPTTVGADGFARPRATESARRATAAAWDAADTSADRRARTSNSCAKASDRTREDRFYAADVKHLLTALTKAVGDLAARYARYDRMIDRRPGRR